MAIVTERAEPPREIAAEPPASPAEPSVPPRRRGVGLLALAAVVGGGVLVALRVAPAFLPQPAAQTISASGRIEGRDVTIAPKSIEGRVSRLFVDEGDTVAAGQALAELEANPLEARAATLAAAIASVDAQIGQATLDITLTAKSSDASIAAAAAGVSTAQARVSRANAVMAAAAADYARGERLFAQSVISRHEFDQMEMALRTSEADVDAAEKDLARARADLSLAQASKESVAVKRQQVRALQENRRAAVSQLAEAQANLVERHIVAPVDGTILSRPVEVGDVVSPGAPMFQLVDLRRLYVKVYVPEPDIPKIALGDRAEIAVDAFPGRTFEARVSKIYDQAEFTPKNVETVEERLKLVFGVELALVNPDRLLKPGMPADCAIHWGEHANGRHGS